MLRPKSRICDLEHDQVNTKFAWLSEATCRSSSTRMVTISEPAVAFYISQMVMGQSRGWRDLLQDPATVIYSINLVTIPAGSIGESLTQALCLMSKDYLSFGSFQPISIPLTEWAKSMVPSNKQIDLEPVGRQDGEEYVGTKDQTADILTKALEYQEFKSCRDKLGPSSF